MNLKKLENATKILEKIKVLDAEIIQIEKFAILVASGETKINLDLKCEDLRKKEDEANKVDLDEDGSIRNGNIINPVPHFEVGGFLSEYLGRWKPPSNLSKNETSIKQELSDTSTLSILGVILCEKQEARRKLIESIKQMGFTV